MSCRRARWLPHRRDYAVSNPKTALFAAYKQVEHSSGLSLRTSWRQLWAKPQDKLSTALD